MTEQPDPKFKGVGSTQDSLNRSDPQPEWWSPREIAELYRVHITTVYRWIEIGKLKVSKIRRNVYRIRREDVEALAEKPEHPEGLKKEEGE